MVVADLMAATEKRVADLWDSQTIMAAHTERRTSPATADHGLQRRAIRWARRRTRGLYHAAIAGRPSWWRLCSRRQLTGMELVEVTRAGAERSEGEKERKREVFEQGESTRD